MRTVVESFKRLYNSGKLTREQVKERVDSGKISAEEYEYITGDVCENETA